MRRGIFPFTRPFRGRDEEFLGISAFFSAILRTRLLILVFRGRGRDEVRNFAPFLGHFEVETRPSRNSARRYYSHCVRAFQVSNTYCENNWLWKKLITRSRISIPKVQLSSKKTGEEKNRICGSIIIKMLPFTLSST